MKYLIILLSLLSCTNQSEKLHLNKNIKQVSVSAPINNPPRIIGICYVTLIRWEPPNLRWQVVSVAQNWDNPDIYFRHEYSAMLNNNGVTNFDSAVRTSVELSLFEVNKILRFDFSWPTAAAAGIDWARGDLWIYRDLVKTIRTDLPIRI